MKPDQPQPPRPTQSQIDAAYGGGLFTCEVEWFFYRTHSETSVDSIRSPARSIPGFRAVWLTSPYRDDAFFESVDSHGEPHSLAERDVMHFPWGRMNVKQWQCWPKVDWWCPAKMEFFLARQSWVRIDDEFRDYYRGGLGPGESVNEMRLFDAGIWSLERCINWPDEVPFAQAAWADPSCYAIYADHVDEQGCELTARALRRVAELTAPKVTA